MIILPNSRSNSLDSSNSPLFNKSVLKNKSSFEKDNNWKVCVNTPSLEDRKNYCNENYDFELMKIKCEVNLLFIYNYFT